MDILCKNYSTASIVSHLCHCYVGWKRLEINISNFENSIFPCFYWQYTALPSSLSKRISQHKVFSNPVPATLPGPIKISVPYMSIIMWISSQSGGVLSETFFALKALRYISKASSRSLFVGPMLKDTENCGYFDMTFYLLHLNFSIPPSPFQEACPSSCIRSRINGSTSSGSIPSTRANSS